MEITFTLKSTIWCFTVTQISNMSIDDIQKNRILLNQNIIQDLKKEVANWGIWIETVEIIEADVMSYSLN